MTAVRLWMDEIELRRSKTAAISREDLLEKISSCTLSFSFGVRVVKEPCMKSRYIFFSPG